jgi:predicted dehydrogenase
MSTLRIGVIGAGAIATLGHIPGFQKIAGVSVVAVCDTNLERAQAVAGQFNIPMAHSDYRDVIANEQIDAISIGVPNALHAEIAIAALEAGKHVLSEKPLATSIADGEAMVAAAVRSGRLLAVNMHMRGSAQAQLLRTLIDEGRLGKIGYVNSRWIRRTGIPGFGSWFTRRDLAGGGVLMDTGVHMLDLAWWLLGCPKVSAVRGEIQSVHGPRERGLGGWGMDRIPGGTFDVEDLALSHLRLADGGLITVEVSWAAYGRHEMRVQVFGEEAGADACADIYGNDSPVRLYRDEGSIPVEVIPSIPRLPGTDWDRSMARFAAAIADRNAPHVPGSEGLAVLKLLDATYRSAREGREIDL